MQTDKVKVTGGNLDSQKFPSLTDPRLLHKALLKTNIPTKRTFGNRQKRSAAYRDDDSDEEPDRVRTTKANDDSDDGKGKNDNHEDYESPPEDNDVVMITAEEKELLQSSVTQSTENAKHLPIFKHRQEIINKLDKNKVVIISGDTGCGKTTQVPKYILETGLARQQDVKIICTQPRKLAAINIAKRVASELNQRVGGTVGYQVGMQRKKTPGVTKITFMTTGIFLMRLVNNPDSLRTYTHLIMDEVHERDLDIDFSLVVVKHLINRSEVDGLKFKLVLMSATFNTTLFANYFSKSSIETIEKVEAYKGTEERYKKEEQERQEKMLKEWGPCKEGEWNADSRAKMEQSLKRDQTDEDHWIDSRPTNVMQMPVKDVDDKCDIIEINARMFEVREFYLCEVAKNMRADNNLKLSTQDKDMIFEALEGQGTQKPQVKEGAMRAASILICDVIHRLNQFNDDKACPKSVLVFLPGLAEIFQFIDHIREFYDPTWIKQNLELIPLHSSLNEEEQDRAFKHVDRMEGRRKIIISTNIAESSVTIPDVKYVIDFMLTKELHYDPVSKSESLQLNWCSKASAKQRKGRAGRVAEGVLFRLSSKRFYENFMPEYPKPEMQRCPLEKLILQIKLWDKYKPEEILGRAIQPPELRDIFNAIKNLQQTGALTTPPPSFKDNETGDQKSSEKYVPKITALGRIFVNLPVDLKITRIFLFGMALKCMQQAINIGAIHAQTRNIFRIFRNSDPINIAKLQCMYDEKRDSDSLMLLRIYTEWISKFHPYLKHRKEDEEQEQARGQRDRQRGDGKRVFIKRPLAAERKWCFDRSLDLNILREIATLAEEIRHRFIRMNIHPSSLNSKVRFREDNPDGELILKTCIGGAFYNKYAKAAYKNEDMLMRMKNNKFFDSEEAKHTLILNKVSDHIHENHLKKFFEGKFKIPVLKVSIQQDKPTIVFGPEILERGFLKAAFKLGARSRMSRYRKLQEQEYEESKAFRSSILSDGRAKTKNVVISYDEVREMLENEELRRPNYLFELRFETINKESYVDFDNDSINNFTMETDMKKLPHITYACQEFYDKGGRFLCRNSTKLPDVPMIDVIFCLIFAPVVQIMADEEKMYFSKVVCDNGELVMPLTHVLTHQDLQIAQKCRVMLNEQLCDEDKQKQAHQRQVDFYVKKLMSFKRISVDIFVKLEALRAEDESKDRQNLLNKIDKHADDEMNFFLTEEEKNDIDDCKSFEDVDMNDEGEIMEDRQQRYLIDSEKGYFLQPLYVQKLRKQIFLYDDMVSDMMKEFQDRVTKKRQMIEQNKLKCKEFALRDTMVICERCKQDLCPLKTLEFEKEDLHYAKCVFGSFRQVSVEEALKNPIYEEDREFVEINHEIFQEEAQEIKSENQKPVPNFSFCECRKKHIVGIVKGQKYYLTDISQVTLMFPSGVYEAWDARFWQKGYKSAFDLQRKLNYQIQQARENSSQNYWNSKRQPKKLTFGEPITSDKKTNHLEVICELCQKVCSDPEEFILHCRKDEIHLKLQEKFTDETYDFLFTDDQPSSMAAAKQENVTMM